MKKADQSVQPLTPGNKIKKVRKHLELTQEQMAMIMGVSRGTISSYEGRSNASPSPEAIRHLADQYSIPIAWFYDGEDTYPTRSRVPLTNPPVPDGGPPSGTYDESIKIVKLVATDYVEDTDMIFVEETDYIPIPEGRINQRDLTQYRVLIVPDNAMGERAPKGSVIYFRKALNPDHGDITLARVLRSGVFFFGVYDGSRNWPCLLPFNEKKIGMGFGVLDVWGVAEIIVRPYVEGQPNTEDNDGKPLKAMRYVSPEALIARAALPMPSLRGRFPFKREKKFHPEE